VGDQTYSGESYSDHIPPSNPDIEYESKNPESSCIEDMDFAELPLWLVLLMCVVPIAGIFFIIRSIRESFEDFYWMSHGLVAKATFVRMEETDIRMNKRKQVSVVYQFTTEDGETIFMNFLKNKSKKKTKPRMELVMYDPRWPEKAKMLWYPVRQYLKSIGEL
jgi:ribosomal protein L33